MLGRGVLRKSSALAWLLLPVAILLLGSGCKKSKDESSKVWVEGTTRESTSFSGDDACVVGTPGCTCILPRYECPGDAQCFWGHCYGEGFPAPDTYRYTTKARNDYEIIKNLIMATLVLEPGMHIADLGAGRGTYTFEMADKVGSESIIYATDIDPGAIAELTRMQAARKKKNPNEPTITPLQVEAPRDTALTSLPDEHLDLVLMINSVTFERGENPQENIDYLRTLLAKLRPGGKVLYHTDWYDPTPGLNLKEISALFGDAGFSGEPHEIPMPKHMPETTFYIKNLRDGTPQKVPLQRGYLLFFTKPGGTASPAR